MATYTPDAQIFQNTWNLPENPFPFLGADQYPDEQVLTLFEIDKEATIRCFGLHNSIIEGSYGTGKTMLLKAIYSFHYSKLIIDLAEKHKSEVVPVYIKFSDIPFGSMNPYKDLILLIYRRMLDTRFVVASFLQDSDWFGKFSTWFGRLTKSGLFAEEKHYAQLSSDVVTKRVGEVFKGEGSFGYDWLKSLGLEFEKNFEAELCKKPNPSITDIESLFFRHFSRITDRVLLLIDEVDSLPKSAFQKADGEKYSIYETLFNQFRTSQFLLYKVAVYPSTESSSQLEGSRIGNRTKLGFDIKNERDFPEARDFYHRILKSYLSFCAKREVDPKDFFRLEYIDNHSAYAHRIKKVDSLVHGDSLEQLIFGSNGVIRRFIKLAGDSMLESARKKGNNPAVGKFDVFDAMRLFGKELLERLQENERALLDRIAFHLIQQKTYRFRAPGKEEMVHAIFDRSKQDNILYPILDEARQGITYIFEFDYCYTIYRNLPTHTFWNAEKVNEQRSLVNGKWIMRPVDVPPAFLNLEAKIEGMVIMFRKNEGWGFIRYLDNKDLWFHKVNIVSLNEEEIKKGARVLFRLSRNYKGECAADIEVL